MINRPPVYRKEALEKLTTPEQFDRLIQITTYQSWMLLAGLGSLILIAVLWGFFGTLTQTTEQRGILLAGISTQALHFEVVLYVPFSTARLLSSGMKARVEPYSLPSDSTDYWQGTIRTVAAQPASHGEMLTVPGSADAVSAVQSSEPLFEVHIQLDGNPTPDTSRNLSSGTPCLVIITVKEEHPISRIFPQAPGI